MSGRPDWFPTWPAKVCSLGELARNYLGVEGKHRLPLPVHVPTKADKVYRTGGNLTQPGAAIGTYTWKDFLSGQA
jgi:hypothetical protein